MHSATRRTRPSRTRALALLGAVHRAASGCRVQSRWKFVGDRFQSAPAGAAKTLTNITIGYPSLTIHLLPFQVAIDQGFFAKQGLDVNSSGSTTVRPRSRG